MANTEGTGPLINKQDIIQPTTNDGVVHIENISCTQLVVQANGMETFIKSTRPFTKFYERGHVPYRGGKLKSLNNLLGFQADVIWGETKPPLQPIHNSPGAHIRSGFGDPCIQRGCGHGSGIRAAIT